jgi:hypothetical protein
MSFNDSSQKDTIIPPIGLMRGSLSLYCSSFQTSAASGSPLHSQMCQACPRVATLYFTAHLPPNHLVFHLAIQMSPTSRLLLVHFHSNIGSSEILPRTSKLRWHPSPLSFLSQMDHYLVLNLFTKAAIMT